MQSTIDELTTCVWCARPTAGGRFYCSTACAEAVLGEVPAPQAPLEPLAVDLLRLERDYYASPYDA